MESSPSASKDTVFVGSADGSLYALYATTGVLKWKAEVGDSVKSSPTVAGGHVFVGASTQRGGQVTALNEQTGQRQWFFRTDGWVTGKVRARFCPVKQRGGGCSQGTADSFPTAFVSLFASSWISFPSRCDAPLEA